MNKRVPFLLCLLSCALPARAQLGRSDLDEIERHRQSRKSVSVLQSLDVPPDSIHATMSLIGTWDFLDEEEKKEDLHETRIERKQLILGKSEVERRLSVFPQEIIIPYNEQIENYIENYVISHAGALKRILGKYFYYEPFIESVFERHGVPGELAALAIVESAMNPQALSPAGARGMWQFMPETAIRYELQCDGIVDERLDPYRSTEAAARYLKAAYKRYGDWPLAISSYNCGPGAVDSAIRKAGATDFWSVYPFLPSETKGYMPALVAALYALQYYTEYDIEVKLYSEIKTQNYKITRRLSFAEIVRKTGIPREELKKLNPQFLYGTIPGNQKPFILRIPAKYTETFKKELQP